MTYILDPAESIKQKNENDKLSARWLLGILMDFLLDKKTDKLNLVTDSSEDALFIEQQRFKT